MAKLRRNHSTYSGKTGTVVRIAIVAAVLIALGQALPQFLNQKAPLPQPSNDYILPADVVDDQEFYLPETSDCEVIQHHYYALCYSEAHEQAQWVAYILTRERVEMRRLERPDRFERDTAVTTGSAHWLDYRGSGYDRGHLAPAADMAFDPIANEESFLMSNISPQVRGFNAGIWRELEELTRDWAKANKKLYVVTGPVLERPIERIGKNGVSVPKAFYKVLLDLSEPEQKGIGFLIPNAVSDKPLSEYACSIDSLESVLGLDMFPSLMTEKIERLVEAQVALSQWPFDPKKYKLRITRWNQIN